MNLHIKSGKEGAHPADVATLLGQRRYTAALAAAIKLEEIEGESCASVMRIARIEMLLGFRPRAQRSWLRALQLSDCAEARLGLGIWYYEGGIESEALHQFNLGLAKDAGHVDLLLAASIAALSMGLFGLAQDYAARGLTIASHNPELLLSSARAQLALGNLAETAQLLKSLGRSSYKPDEVLLLQSELQVRSGDVSTCLVDLAELCQRQPRSSTSIAAFREAFKQFRANTLQTDIDEFSNALAHPPAPWRVCSPAAELTVRREKIDIIIPVHNALTETKRCLDSVLKWRDSARDRIILVDDASSPDTASYLADCAKNYGLTLIRLPQRQGFTRAVKSGLSESSANVIAVLNSDTIVTEAWTERLYTALRSSPDTAMVGPLSNNAAWQNYGPVLDHSGVFTNAPIPPEDEEEVIARKIAKLGQNALAEISMLHGFCVMADRRCYDAVEGLDESLFPEGYGEFQDLSLRLRAAGYRLFVALGAVVFHAKAASIGQHRRAALSLKGRESLYDRYSALNYLYTESSCIYHRDIGLFRRLMQKPS